MRNETLSQSKIPGHGFRSRVFTQNHLGEFHLISTSIYMIVRANFGRFTFLSLLPLAPVLEQKPNPVADQGKPIQPTPRHHVGEY